MKAIREELMKSVLGRIVWIVFIVTIAGWVATAVVNILSAVWLGIITLFDKNKNND